MAYGWVITEDKFHPNYTFAMGPSGCKFSREEILEKGLAFRMLDDDHEVYVYGRCMSDEEGGIGEEYFGPLDDYGTPGLGCTMIQYDVGNGWETL